MKDLIKKILKEFDDFGWAEEKIEGFDPYKMDGNDLIYFLNQFFKQNKSPKFGRTYEAYQQHSNFIISDETGVYYGEDMEGTNLYKIISELRLSMDSLKDKDVEISEEYGDLLDTLKPLIMENINESNEWEWVDETLDQAVNPYKMDDDDLVYFLNQFFQQNKSPRFGRKYVAEHDGGTFSIGDETGLYVTILTTDETFYYVINSLKRSLENLTHNVGLLDEYQDLYDTLIPLIKEDIREQANDMEWFDIDDMPEPKGFALANIIDEYFKDNNLPYHIMIRQDNAVIYIKDTNFIYFSGWTELFTMDNIINDIMIDLDSLQSSKSINRWNTLYKNLKFLFDKLK